MTTTLNGTSELVGKTLVVTLDEDSSTAWEFLTYAQRRDFARGVASKLKLKARGIHLAIRNCFEQQECWG